MELGAQPTGTTQPKSGIRKLLSVCESYLSKGDYTTCRDFAVKAQICYPKDPGPVQILAICSVLASASYGSTTTRPDWYSILHLPPLTADQSSIEKNFNRLSNLLNPTKNPYPFAATAHEWVTKAWTVLSEPTLKSMVDRDLKMGEKFERNDETFWTRCPNCFCMYEYENKFNGCLLKCQNAKCRVVFRAEQIPASATPPPKLVNGEVYVCYGFSPLGRGREWKGGPEEWKCWWPFVSTVSGQVKKNKGNFGKEDKDGVQSEVKDEGISGTNEVKSDVKDGGISGINVESEGEKTGDDVQKQSNGGKMARKMKIKTMARTSKKVAGRGIRINFSEIFPPEKADDGEEGAMEMEGGEKGVLDDGLGLNFMDGVDDVFVSLDSIFGVDE